MKKIHIIILQLLLYSTTLRAANIIAAEYYFDNDPGIGNCTALSVSAGATVNYSGNITVPALSIGIHALYIRTKDDNGKWSLAERRIFNISTTIANSTQVIASEYFFDNDPGVGNATSLAVNPAATVNINNGITLPTMSLGIHSLFIRTKNNSGMWSLQERRIFNVIPAIADQVTGSEYFFDSDPGLGNATPLVVTPNATVNVNTSIAVPSMTTGIHGLFIRTRNNLGMWSLQERRIFNISSPVSNATQITSAEFYVDNDPGTGNGISIPVTTPGANVNQCSAVTLPFFIAGSHKLFLRTKDDKNSWSLSEPRPFNGIASGNISISPTSPVTICGSGTVTLTANATGGYSNLQWYYGCSSIPGATSSVYNANNAGTYFVMASNGVQSQTAFVQVNISPLPAVYALSGNGSYCSSPGTGADIILSGSEPGTNYQLVLNGSTNIPGPITGTGNTLAFNGITVPGNYTVTATNAAGCTSSMTGSITVSMVAASHWYRDFDGDGFGDPAYDSLLCSQPAGFVSNNTDCDDHNGAANASTSWFLDADNDGHYLSVQQSCGSPGAGWNLTANTQGDCNDADNSTWQEAMLYIDSDGDGYDAGNAVICYGASIPNGYSLNSLGSDCNDGNSAIHTQVIFYADNDADGFGTGPGIPFCQLTPPSGFSANNQDCNDSDNSIYPGAIEIPCNGIDENCNGMSDDLGIPSSPATGIISTAPYNELCAGGSVSLTLIGGSLGTGASWVWYEGGCGTGVPVGTGTSIVITPLSLGVHNYFVRAEGACGNTACQSVSISVINAPPAGTIHYTATSSNGCLNSTAQVFSVNAITNCSYYNWSSTNIGVLFNGNPGPYQTTVPSVNITYSSLPGGGNSGWSICVFGGNACGNTNTVCSWVRATVSRPSSIAGPIIGCPGSIGNGYLAAAVAGAATYQWSATGGMVINNNGSQNVTVDFPSGFISGVLSVHAQTSCGYGGTNATITIARAPAIPGVITGNSYPCPNITSVYSIAAVPGAANYTWTTSVPGAVVNGSGTSCSILYPASIPSGSYVSVVANSSCPYTSAIRSKGIASGVANIPSSISGPVSGQCGQSGVSYSILPVALATGYNWSTTCGNIVGPANLSGVTIDWPANFSNCTLSVSATNACGTGYARTLAVTATPGLPPAISGNASPCANSIEAYTTLGSTGATSYTWTVPAGAVILGPVNGSSILVQWGSAGGNITVKATNDCGNSSVRSLPCVIACRMSQTNATIGTIDAKVFPNPTSDKTTLLFNSSSLPSYHMEIINMLGQSMLTKDGMTANGLNALELDLHSLAKGVYLLQLTTGSDKEEIKVVVQ